MNIFVAVVSWCSSAFTSSRWSCSSPLLHCDIHRTTRRTPPGGILLRPRQWLGSNCAGTPGGPGGPGGSKRKVDSHCDIDLSNERQRAAVPSVLEAQDVVASTRADHNPCWCCVGWSHRHRRVRPGKSSIFVIALTQYRNGTENPARKFPLL